MQHVSDIINSAGGLAGSITAVAGLIAAVCWKPYLKPLLGRRKAEKEKAKAEEAEFRKSVLGFISAATDRMQAIEDSIDANEKDRIRREMFTFAAECRRGEQHTLDEFRHIISIKDKYDDLLEKTGDSNGVFDAEYRYIVKIYEERQEQNDFLT